MTGKMGENKKRGAGGELVGGGRGATKSYPRVTCASARSKLFAFTSALLFQTRRFFPLPPPIDKRAARPSPYAAVGLSLAQREAITLQLYSTELSK